MHASDAPARHAGELRALLEKARSLHPDITVPLERFAALLGRSLPEDPGPAAAPGELHLGDLYLAYAYGLGHEAARARVETEHFTRIQRRLERMRTPPAIIADILQELRCRLVELSEPETEPARSTYSGRGSLGGWLFIAAIRSAERSVERARREVSDTPNGSDGSDGAEPLPLRLDPETEHLVQSYKATFEEAMKQALASLSRRERNLLRFHFLERLSIDRLAEMYRVHRATAARWIVRAQQRLAEETVARFRARIPTGEGSVPRLLHLIRSKLDLDLSAALQRAPEPED